MIFPLRAPRWALLPQRIRGVFNLNDPRWGRGDEPVGGDGRQGEPKQPDRRPSGSGGQPPDLDELWRDLNRRLSGLFGVLNSSSI